MKTFMVQASLMIVTYDRKNMFIVQATGREEFLFTLPRSIGMLVALVIPLTLFKDENAR
jgi:hypothetical protein